MLKKESKKVVQNFALVEQDLVGFMRRIFSRYEDPGKYIKDVNDILEFITKSKNKIYTFQKLKLLQIGDTDTKGSNFKLMVELLEGKKFNVNVPENISPEDDLLIGRYLFKNAGKLYANELKKKIIEYSMKFPNLGFEKEFPIKNMFSCVLKTIDFLFNNGFIDQETLRKIIQETMNHYRVI